MLPKGNVFPKTVAFVHHHLIRPGSRHKRSTSELAFALPSDCSHQRAGGGWALMVMPTIKCSPTCLPARQISPCGEEIPAENGDCGAVEKDAGNPPTYKVGLQERPFRGVLGPVVGPLRERAGRTVRLHGYPAAARRPGDGARVSRCSGRRFHHASSASASMRTGSMCQGRPPIIEPVLWNLSPPYV